MIFIMHDFHAFKSGGVLCHLVATLAGKSKLPGYSKVPT